LALCEVFVAPAPLVFAIVVGEVGTEETVALVVTPTPLVFPIVVKGVVALAAGKAVTVGANCTGIGNLGSDGPALDLSLLVVSIVIVAGPSGSCPPSSSPTLVNSLPSFAPKDAFCVPSNGVPLPFLRAPTNI